MAAINFNILNFERSLMRMLTSRLIKWTHSCSNEETLSSKSQGFYISSSSTLTSTFSTFSNENVDSLCKSLGWLNEHIHGRHCLPNHRGATFPSDSKRRLGLFLWIIFKLNGETVSLRHKPGLKTSQWRDILDFYLHCSLPQMKRNIFQFICLCLRNILVQFKLNLHLYLSQILSAS